MNDLGAALQVSSAASLTSWGTERAGRPTRQHLPEPLPARSKNSPQGRKTDFQVLGLQGCLSGAVTVLRRAQEFCLQSESLFVGGDFSGSFGSESTVRENMGGLDTR